MLQYNEYIKVIELGIAKDRIGKDYTSSILGTAHYMSSEIILGKLIIVLLINGQWEFFIWNFLWENPLLEM